MRVIKVKTISETLDYISKHTASVARFGDGEIDIIAGNSIPYQVYDSELAKRLKRLLNRQSNEKLVICVSDVFDNLGRYNDFGGGIYISIMICTKKIVRLNGMVQLLFLDPIWIY